MDATLKQQVLDTIQSGYPIGADPYGTLAVQLGCSRDAVMDAVYALCIEGSVRRIGASFDSRKLGYSATLCALAVPGGEDELVRAAEAVSLYPGVTHNYGRAHRYNLWFTLITPSEEQKRAVLDCIRHCTGCDDLLDMPATRKFKISVDFGKQRAAQNGESNERAVPACGKGEPHCGERESSGGESEPCGMEPGGSVRPFDADDPFDVELVRWSQDDIARDGHGELVEDPYAVGAAHLSALLGRDSITEERVITRLRELKAIGVVRRFGAMVRHQRIGFAFNSMTAWDIPDEAVAQAGNLFAGTAFVSHCYTRPRYPTWPANLYGMVHAQSAEELAGHIAALERLLGDAGVPCNGHFALETTHEFKKVSMRYFSDPPIPAEGCICSDQVERTA